MKSLLRNALLILQEGPRYPAAALSAILMLGALLAPTASGALTQEQALANCREGVGHPILHACMQGLKGSGGEMVDLCEHL